MINLGVFPVYDNVFKTGKAGRTSAASDMVPIAEMESFSVSIDGNIEEWTPMNSEGWKKHMATSKSITISLSGKLCPSDPGNAYVAGLAWKNGTDCDSKFEWDFPDGGKVTFDCVVNVKDVGGGDSTNIAGLEFDVMSHGKPAYTPADSE